MIEHFTIYCGAALVVFTLGVFFAWVLCRISALNDAEAMERKNVDE